MNRGMRSSSSCCSTHDRSALVSSWGGSGRMRSGGRGRMRTRVGAVGRGRGRSPHLGSLVVSSTRLSNAWAREWKDMKRMGGGGLLL